MELFWDEVARHLMQWGPLEEGSRSTLLLGPLRLRILNPSHVPERKHRTVAASMPTDPGTDRVRAASDGSQGHKRKDHSLFYKNFLSSKGYVLSSQGIRERSDAISLPLPHTVRLHRPTPCPHGRLELLIPSPPIGASFPAQVCEAMYRALSQNPSTGPLQAPSLLIVECSKASALVLVEIGAVLNFFFFFLLLWNQAHSFLFVWVFLVPFSFLRSGSPPTPP